MQHGCRFQALDLRWGVREEAALDQQTMRICLGEIERCQRVTPRPNFIPAKKWCQTFLLRQNRIPGQEALSMNTGAG